MNHQSDIPDSAVLKSLFAVSKVQMVLCNCRIFTCLMDLTHNHDIQASTMQRGKSANKTIINQVLDDSSRKHKLGNSLFHIDLLKQFFAKRF